MVCPTRSKTKGGLSKHMMHRTAMTGANGVEKVLLVRTMVMIKVMQQRRRKTATMVTSQKSCGNVGAAYVWYESTTLLVCRSSSDTCVYKLILMSGLKPLVLLVISLVFSALICMPKAVEVLSRRSTKSASSSSLPARPSMSSTKRKFVILLPPMLTVIHGHSVRQS